MTHLITLSIFAVSRPAPDASAHDPRRERDGFAAVSSVSTPPEGTSAISQLAAYGWTVDDETDRRQLVRIQLPAGVEVGPYLIGNVKRCGLHASAAGRAARDGMGASVYVSAADPASVQAAGSEDAAFAAAVDSGIILSIPCADGTRRREFAQVEAVSPIFTAYQDPTPWAEELSAQIDRETAAD